jgi:hypothetical protein
VVDEGDLQHLARGRHEREERAPTELAFDGGNPDVLHRRNLLILQELGEELISRS